MTRIDKNTILIIIKNKFSFSIQKISFHFLYLGRKIKINLQAYIRLFSGIQSSLDSSLVSHIAVYDTLWESSQIFFSVHGVSTDVLMCNFTTYRSSKITISELHYMQESSIYWIT